MTTANTAQGASGWEPYLDPAEELVWEGRPATGLKLKASDAFMIPFSLVWGGFAIFWEYMAITMGAPFFFALFGLPFVAIGLYLIVGRFFWDAYTRDRTRYALTTQRAIIATSHMGRKMRSIPITASSPIEYSPGPEATIILDSRVEGTGKNRRTIRHGFFYIPDGDKVYRHIRYLQEQSAGRDDDSPWG